MNPGIFPSQLQAQAYWRLRRQAFTASGIWASFGVVREVLVSLTGAGGSGNTRPVIGCCPPVDYYGGTGGSGVLAILAPPSSVPLTITSGIVSFGSFATATPGSNASTTGAGGGGGLTYASSARLMSTRIGFSGGEGGLGAGSSGGPALAVVEWMELVNP